MTNKLSLYTCYVAGVLLMSKIVLPYYVDSHYVIDLMQYIVVQNDSWDGSRSLTTVPGANNHSTAYVFQGSSRQVEVASEAVHNLQNLLQKRNEFTVLASVKQQENSTGSIVTFSAEGHRYLELESSGRRDEIRLHYHPRPPDPDGTRVHAQTLTFPYRLADGRWHKLALAISPHFVQLYVDCRKIYETQLPSLDLSHLAASRTVRLWLGQRDEKQAHFKGAIEYIKVVLFPEGHQVQCPHADIPCPTCRQYYQLESSVQELYKVIEQLNKKLLETENRLSAVEQCECMSSCHVNGTRYRDGESWTKERCTTCTCRAGQISCVPPVCPAPKCKHPVLQEGDCCPSCLPSNPVPILRTIFTAPVAPIQNGHCYYSGKKYDHLEEYYPRECIKCTCRNGRMTCHREEQCPELDCPPEQQVAVEGQCCKFCKGLDYCSKGHDCHQNATCYNLDTKYTCQCNDGFIGDGKTCEDLDECQSEGGHHGHYCHSNTKCINTLGSYKCECLPGYVRENQFACRELDECQLGLHDCHPHAHCINTEGSFVCRCSSGYHGDGRTCQPTCSEACLNGGSCIAPDTCSCRSGYVGDHCQTDVDECKEGLANCHPNSVCVNIPGQYYCKCKKGYHSNHYDNLNGVLCRDVNECGGWGEGHRCPAGTECVNTPGGYECLCREQSECSAACQIDGEFHANGTAWEMPGEPCSECICKNGEVRCSRRSCDCAGGYADPKCCPQCAPEQQCRHQDLPITYYSGDTWIYQCQICECLRGEIDCWALECPPLSCTRVIHEDGDCCPRCVEEDPCHVPPRHSDGDKVSVMSMVCFFDGKKYFSGDSWVVPWDGCSVCTCQAGQICCTYNETCAANEQSAFTDRSYGVRETGVKLSSEKRKQGVGQREQRPDPEEVELWQLWHKSWGRPVTYGHRVNPSPDDKEGSGLAAASEQPGVMPGIPVVHPRLDPGYRTVIGSPGDGNPGSHVATVNIPGGELPRSSDRRREHLAPAHASGASSARGRQAGEIDSAAALPSPRTSSNSELTDGEGSSRSPGLAGRPDLPAAGVGSPPSEVLSHARKSRSNKKSSRRQGRRGQRKRRKRLQLIAASRRAAARGRLAAPSPGGASERELLERELKKLANRRRQDSWPEDAREKASGRRRKNFDGGG